MITTKIQWGDRAGAEIIVETGVQVAADNSYPEKYTATITITNHVGDHAVLTIPMAVLTAIMEKVNGK